MRPVAVVVLFEFAKDDRGVSLVDDQDSVEQFAAEGCRRKRSAIALARGARIGVLLILTSRAVKAVSERGGELGSRSRDEKPEAAAGTVEVHEQCCGPAGSARLRRDER
jgi:hypothetical protein